MLITTKNDLALNQVEMYKEIREIKQNQQRIIEMIYNILKQLGENK